MYHCNSIQLFVIKTVLYTSYVITYLTNVQWTNVQIKIYINYTLPHRANVTTKYILYFRPISKYHKARYNVTEFTVLKHMHISIKKKDHIINEYKFISCAFRKL